VAFTDDGKTVMDPVLLYEIFQTAAKLDVLIASHCEDHHLVQGGAMHRGEVSRLLGDVGIPALGEELVIARDLLFAADTGARLHIQHVSTARGVQLIREAKARGVRVTAEATPHHFSLTDAAVWTYGALAKVNPPLRPEADRVAVVAGLQDGTLDAIATDHAPHTLAEKRQGLTQAPFGFVGLETSVGLAFTHLVHTGKLSADQVIAKMTVAPAQILALPIPQLAVGAAADITVIDPDFEWTVDPGRFFSKAGHSPFAGAHLRGKAVATVVGGRLVYSEREGLRT
jgi:dihydroorotase